MRYYVLLPIPPYITIQRATRYSAILHPTIYACVAEVARQCNEHKAATNHITRTWWTQGSNQRLAATKHHLRQTLFTSNNLHTGDLLRQTPFTPNNFYTTHLWNQTNTFYTRHLYAETFYTKHLLHHTPFTSYPSETKHLLAQKTFTPFTPDPFTQITFYIHQITSFCITQLLHQTTTYYNVLRCTA